MTSLISKTKMGPWIAIVNVIEIWLVTVKVDVKMAPLTPKVVQFGPVEESKTAEGTTNSSEH